MAHKKKMSNRSAGGGEFVSYDVKRLRHMSAEEIQAYYDQVEPVADDEVQEVFDRVMPKISYEIATIEQKKQLRHARGKIGKIVLVAVCLTLIFSVVAQALGVPVWEVVTSWTREHLRISIKRTETLDTGVHYDRKELTKAEIETWGEDIYNALKKLNFFPPLPSIKPSGLTLADLFYMDDDVGRIYICAFYVDDRENTLTIVIEKLADEQYTDNYVVSIEKDAIGGEEIKIGDTKYYATTNRGSNSFTWNHNNIVYKLFTTFDKDVVIDMLASIQY